MKQTCSTCGYIYELEPSGFHLCPQCVLAKMKYPYGITPKHTPTGAAADGVGTSHISDEVSGEQIFKYLTKSNHSKPSGAELIRSTKHNSVNAICHMPLDKIPGSGIATSGDQPASFAVLYDVEGKNSPGPHFAFYTADQIRMQMSTDWVCLPKCSKCNQITVNNAGDVCLNCKGTAKP
jgi:hypothetical protein